MKRRSHFSELILHADNFGLINRKKYGDVKQPKKVK